MGRQGHDGKSRGYESGDAAGLMAAANRADTKRWMGHAMNVRVDTTSFVADGSPEGFGDLAAIEFGYALGALNRGETSAFDATLARMSARRAAVAGNPLMASPRGMSEVMEKTLR